MIETAFNLSAEPNVKKTTAFDYREGGDESRNLRSWFRFTGSEILALARFCYLARGQQPVLIAMSQTSVNGVYAYEGFKIEGVSLSYGQADIHFYDSSDNRRFSLKLIPDQMSSPSGDVISCIETDSYLFPRKEYLEFRANLSRRPTQVPRLQPQEFRAEAK